MAEDSPQFRLHILVVVALSLFGVLAARLWFLQVVSANEFRVEAASNVIRVDPEQGPRGSIKDRNGNVLAEDRATTVVTVDRMALNEALDDDERDDMLLRLALEINRAGGLIKVTDIDRDLNSDTFSRFDEVPIAYDVSENLLVYVGERPDEFPGVSVSETTVRHYPYGNLLAHVLGYVGPINESEYDSRAESCDPAGDVECKPYQRGDQIGKSGIERIYENVLRGYPGSRTFVVNRLEEVVSVGERVFAQSGNDIWLTIDIDLQAVVESELARTLAAAREQDADVGEPAFRAPAGSAVILDPQDGTVLAMASYPTYDPAAFVGGISQREFDRLQDPNNASPILNRAIQGTYAPGSTFKLVTGYAAMAEGVIGPNGLVEIDGKINDTGTYVYPFCLDDADAELCTFESPFRGEQSVDLAEALTVSSDVYFYKIGGEGFWPRDEGEDEGIQTWARRLGLGSPTGIDLPFESSGVVPDRELFQSRFEERPDVFAHGRWAPGDTINLAIGQGDLLVTPLQMANVYAAFASDVRHQPNVVAEIRTHDDEPVQTYDPRAVADLDTPEWMREPLIEGLVGVTWRDGTGGGTAFPAFNLPGLGGVDFPLERWPVMGKTGTAEVDEKADSSWFVGVGPVANPEIPSTARAVPRYAMAVVLEEAGFGSQAAAPMVARVFELIAEGAVPEALTAAAREACYVEQDDAVPAGAEVEGEVAPEPEPELDAEVEVEGPDPCDPTSATEVAIVSGAAD